MSIIAYLGKNVKEYNEQSEEYLENLQIYCAVHPTQKMKKHDKYTRGIKETGEKIKIYRLICPECRKTIAVLPDFLLPNKHYSANEIESVVMQSENTAIYDIDTPASVDTVRRWLHEMHQAITAWVSALKMVAIERKCPVSETILADLAPIEQIRVLKGKLPRIKCSGNLLGYAGIWLSPRQQPGLVASASACCSPMQPGFT